MGAAIRKVEGWGWLGVGTTEKGVAKVILPQESKDEVENALSLFKNEVNQQLAEQCADLLASYLRGLPVALNDLPIDWSEVPKKHRRILETLRQEVKLGQTITYGELAHKCGIPKGARLVGQAMAKNPMPLLIPCHRVVRSDGSLGGFSGGVGLKRRLLDLERQICGLSRKV